MTDPESFEERVAIVQEGNAWLPAQAEAWVADAALRMAAAMWLADPASALTPTQAAWLRTRLADRAPFTPQELARLTPTWLAWAGAFNADLEAVLRQCLGMEPRPSPARPRDMHFLAGKVQENAE